MRERRFVVGDVHGCNKTVVELVQKLIQPKQSDLFIFVGDLIDRGPNPKAVVDFVLELKNYCKVVAIRGNHEQMLLDAISDAYSFQLWLINGCEQTLRSFSVVHPSQIAQQYIDFFANMPFYYSMTDFVITHGDMNCDAEDPFADTRTMLWGRYLPFKPEKINNRRLVVGHTPTPLDVIRRSLKEPKIYIDGGCVYKGSSLKTNLGYLVALELNSFELFVQPNIDF